LLFFFLLTCLFLVLGETKISVGGPAIDEKKAISDELKQIFYMTAQIITKRPSGHDVKKVEVVELIEIDEHNSVIYGTMSSDTFQGVLFENPQDGFYVFYDTPKDLAVYDEFLKMNLSAKIEHIKNDFKTIAHYEFSDKKFLPDAAKNLYTLAGLYYEIGDYGKAQHLYKRVISITEDSFGPEHPDIATCLTKLVDLYMQIADYSKAEPLLKRAISIQKKAFGPEHLETSESLNYLALLYKYMGNYTRAEPLYQQALSIGEKVLGPQHPDIATYLNNLAALYDEIGNYGKAESLFQRSLSIKKKAFGPEHPETATGMNNLAALYVKIADFDKAEFLYQRALSIREKAFGPEHIEIASSLNHLAVMYVLRDDNSKAEPMFKRALSIREKNFGPEHPVIASSLNNLAVLYHKMDNCGKALSLYKRALSINEKALGPEHPYTAESFNNLAELYKDIGDYAKAEPMFKRALSIREKILGPEHPNVAGNLNTLAALYWEISDYAKAEPLYQRALSIREKAFGPEHPDIASCLNNLAVLNEDKGDYAKAETLYKRALSIIEQAFGPEHIDTAACLNNLAGLYENMGDYLKSESLYKRSLSIHKKTLGSGHQYTAASLTNLAILNTKLGNFKKAYALSINAQKASAKLIDQVIGFSSEDQKLQFLVRYKKNFEIACSLVAFHMQNNPDAPREILDNWLGLKGIILEAQKRYQDALVYSDNPEVALIFNELSRVRGLISKFYFSRLPNGNLEEHRKRLTELEIQKQGLEDKLIKLSNAFERQIQINRATTRTVSSALPQETAMLEIAKINRFNFDAKENETSWMPAHYLVFVIHPNQKVKLIDLGPAVPIDKIIQTFKSKNRHRGAGRELYDLVFAKIRPELGNLKEIFISPDGNLSLIPFEILQDPNGRYLIEDFTFNYLSAGRDIVGFGGHNENSRKPLLIGAPNFDLGIDSSTVQAQTSGLLSGLTGSGKRSADIQGMHFDPLPGSLIEVKSISKTIGADKCMVRTGDNATEQVLFQAESPRILHIATHGFFLSDQDLPTLKDDRGIVSQIQNPAPAGKHLKIENPLIRSGLALSGANHALSSQNVATSQGLLTAEKVLGLKLKGTDLVVLSACNTGMGVIQNGQGIYGLQRAFFQAGAKSLIISMWPVPDKETKELMIQLYKNIQAGMNRCQALHQAALRQKDIVEKRYKHSNPLYWGAFLFLGEP
jgi:tetratricopeptide (TPR) repeat protein/CHAT domain-containing protein